MVFDFGTGTDILAIFAEKAGAKNVIAIDNDDWSINNALENFERNNAERIEVYQSDEIPTNFKFDIILANINKHVIMATLQDLAAQLKPGGELLISGFLSEDEMDILTRSKEFNFFLKFKLLWIKWISLHLWIN